MKEMLQQALVLRQQLLTGTNAAAAPASPLSGVWPHLAVALVSRRAGAQSMAASFGLSPAPESSRAECGPAAAMALQAILNPEDAVLLPEWCRLAAASGCAPPPARLPLLLDWAGSDEERRALLRACCGSREGWLAAFRPDWRWVLAAPPGVPALRQQWDEGKEAERHQAFLAIRRQDPAQARQWLTDGWKDCPPELRAACIGALLQGLSADDETLLEQALDDRRKPVREAAQALLARLPSSSYSKRTRVIAAQAFVVQRSGLLRRRQLDTAQPRLDAGAARDGWDAGRQWVADDFRRLLQRTPLAFWLDDCALGIPECLELVAGLGPDFLLSLLVAIHERGDEAWLRAGLARVDAAFINAAGATVQRADQVPLALVARLPAGERPDAGERCLSLSGGIGWTHAVGQAVPAPWSAGFTRRFVQHLHAAVEKPYHVASLPAVLQLAVLRAPPEALQAALLKILDQPPAWPSDEPALQRWRTAWQDGQRLLDKRLAIRQAFQVSPSPSSNGIPE